MLCDYLSPQDSFYKALLVAYWQNKNASSYLKTIPSAQLICVFLDWQKDHGVCVLYSQRQIGNQRQAGTYLIKTEYAFVRASCLSRVPLIAMQGTIAFQALLSMGFFRQEYCSGLPCPSPGNLPDPGIKPAFLMSPALAGRFFFVCLFVCLFYH